MIKVKGVYNGVTVELLDSVSIPANTAVEVLFETTENGEGRSQALRLLHEKLVAEGIMHQIPMPFDRVDAEEPLNLDGESASEWIIRNRR